MSTFNRTTLVKVLEILDSSNAGEALAAAKLASTMLREAGLTWDDVLAPEIHGRADPTRSKLLLRALPVSPGKGRLVSRARGHRGLEPAPGAVRAKDAP